MSDDKHPPIPPMDYVEIGMAHSSFNHSIFGFGHGVVFCGQKSVAYRALMSFIWRKIEKERYEKANRTGDVHDRAEEIRARENWLAWDEYGEKTNE